jgi:ribonuclease R
MQWGTPPCLALARVLNDWYFYLLRLPPNVRPSRVRPGEAPSTMKNPSRGRRRRRPASKSPDTAHERRPGSHTPAQEPSICNAGLEEAVLSALQASDYRPASTADLARLLRLDSAAARTLGSTLSDLRRQGRVHQTKAERWILTQEADLVPGVIQITRQGRGFLQPDTPGLKEIAIPDRATGTAMHGDRVLVRRDVPPGGRSGDPALTGAVVSILERKRTRVVGTLTQGKRFLHVIPDDPRMQHQIVVPEPRDTGRPARHGDKVVVEILTWLDRYSSPEGEVVEVLGPPDQEGVDMLSVLRQYDLPLSYPRAVLREATEIARSQSNPVVTPLELERRLDCRAHPVITIDPDDAKDFDDAICVRPAGTGKWRLWVHIADVSHYIRPGTALDTEARRRGNSTYLVDRVIPMLPEALSNDLCSLKPGVDRLTKCAEFLLDDQGRILQTRFYSAVIHSKRRFTYQEAMAVIETRQPGSDLEAMLLDANRLAQTVRRARMKHGSLDLDFPENKIRLDENGRFLRMDRMENDESHQLIEEFMLLANEAVASEIIRRRTPAPHRIHESPKDEKLEEFRQTVLSHGLPCGNLSRRQEIQRLLRRLKEHPAGAALRIGFLRSLMRARYSVEALGHYGLHKERYTHFTSPIRRYADLVVHRVLFDNLKPHPAEIAKVTDHISGTERNSADAERDSREVKLYAHLESQLDSPDPDSFEALVTEVRNFGFFIDVPGLGLSGLVHLSSLADDFYLFDPQRVTLTGRQTRRIIRLGDKLQVRVQRVDRAKRQIDFCLADSPRRSTAKKTGGTSSGQSGQRWERRKPRDQSAPGSQKENRESKRPPDKRNSPKPGARKPRRKS